MSESVRELGQRYLAALWDSAQTLDADTAKAAERLGGLVETVAEAEAQLAGLRLHLLNEARLAAADGVIDQVRNSVRTTSGQAAAALKLAAALGDRFPLIGAALQEGRLSVAQADAIVTVLVKLPGRFTRADLTRCEESILAEAENLGPGELRTLTMFLLELVDPDSAERDEARRLAREERAAHRNRSFRLTPDHHGSHRLSGSLPDAEALLLQAQVEALMPPSTQYQEVGEVATRDVRRADGLILLIHTAANTGALPAHGGDRPTVHITLDVDTLTSGLGRVGLLGSSDVTTLSAGDARRMACDATLIPIVLGGQSRPLDVGRERRPVTPAIRAALLERDGGCVFPGCAAGPAPCEAHHIIPWVQEGDTSQTNLVLQCPFHHRLVEPDPMQSAESQWQVHIDPVTGLPWFTPPRHIDPRRRPRQHARIRLRHHRDRTPDVEAPPCPDTDTPPGPDVDPWLPPTSEAWKQPDDD